MDIVKDIRKKTYQLLRWSQKYTETDMVYLAKGGFWLTIGQVVSTLASFLLAIAFANSLDPVTYGNYKYVLSLTGFFAIFTLHGMRTAIIQAVAKNLEGSFYEGFKTKLKFGISGSIVTIGLASYYLFKGNYTLPIPLFILAIFLPLMYASGVYESFLTGKKLFNVGTKYSIVRQIIFVGTMITTLFLTKNLVWLIAVYFVSNTFLNYFFYLFTKKKFQPNKKEDPQTLSYGKHLTLIGVIAATANHLDKILVFTIIGSAQLAIYSFAIVIPIQIRSILKNIDVLALPKLAAKPRKEIKTSLIKKTLKLFFLVGIIIAVYIMVAPYIYKIFFPQYLDSIPYSQLLIFSLIGFPTSLLITSFQAKMMKRELYLLQTISALRIVLLITLTHFYGIWGVGGAIVGSEIFSLALVLFLFRKF